MITMTLSPPARRGRPPRPAVRFTRSAGLALTFVLFVLAGYATYVLFQSEIGRPDSGVQADYKIDAYYYLYLGGQAIEIAERSSISLYDAADSIRPNAASDGIVFLSALLQWTVPLEPMIPLVLALALFALIAPLVREGHADRLLGALPLCGLFPYLQVPSKEVFFLLGLLAVALSVTRPGRLWALLLGLTLMYFGRRDAFYIFAASVPLAWLLAHRLRALVSSIALLAVYLAFGRELALDTATLAHLVSERQDLAFCSVGPLNVCVEDLSTLEPVFVVRLLTLCALPLKWIWDALATLWMGGLAASEILIRWCNVLQLVWLVWVIRTHRPASGVVGAFRRVLVVFSLAYWVVYATVVYYQPTRQAVLTMTYLGLAFVMHERTRVRRTHSPVKDEGPMNVPGV